MTTTPPVCFLCILILFFFLFLFCNCNTHLIAYLVSDNLSFINVREKLLDTEQLDLETECILCYNNCILFNKLVQPDEGQKFS